jgi:hypothetical protein
MLFSCLFLSSYLRPCLPPPSLCRLLLTSLSHTFSIHFFLRTETSGSFFWNGGYSSALPFPYSSLVLSLRLRSPSSSLSPPRSPLPLLYPLSSSFLYISIISFSPVHITSTNDMQADLFHFCARLPDVDTEAKPGRLCSDCYWCVPVCLASNCAERGFHPCH